MPDAPKSKKSKPRQPQLRVVFDTNALYVTPTSIGSASDLLRDEISKLIAQSKYPDLEILWYLPEVVRHERQYQMESEALKLRYAINKIEKLLGHNLALTDKALIDQVRIKIDEKEKELGLQEIKLNHSLIDWQSLVHAAVYRQPPFQIGEKEKGFRDALVAESFLQLLNESPKTPSSCRVVLVTSDDLLTEAVEARITDLSNASVLAGIEELKGLINTLVSNVSEEFIAQLLPKAASFFFVSSEDKDTLFYKEKIGDQINEKFKNDLEKLPEGTSFRKNGTRYISRPNFSRKEGKRIFWTTRIEIEVEAGTTSKESLPHNVFAQRAQGSTLPITTQASSVSNPTLPNMATPIEFDWSKVLTFLPSPTENKVLTQKGRDVFEVLWSTEVTMARELKKAEINDLRHVELRCQPAT